MKHMLWRNGNHSLDYQSIGYKKLNLTHMKTRRTGHLFPLASGDDGVTVNGTPSASANSDVEDMRVKLNQSLQGEDSGDKLVQSLHDAARVFEVAIKEQGLLSKFSWLSTAWLGIDRNAWVKTLCYQVYFHLWESYWITCIIHTPFYFPVLLLRYACLVHNIMDARSWPFNVIEHKYLIVD